MDLCGIECEKVAGGRSSVVEFQPSKLAVVGSNPIARSNLSWPDSGRLRNGCGEKMYAVMAHVAQLVEHVLGKDEVTRSIRVVGSRRSLLGLKR
ncbi:MAG: hypothetical protein RL042_510 [Nitrospirota bacterium]